MTSTRLPWPTMPGGWDREGPEPVSRWDVMLTAALMVGTSFWGDLMANHQGHYVASVLTSLAITAPVVLRRRRPLLMLAIVSVASLVQCVTVSGPTASLLAVPVVAYSVAKWVSGHDSRLVLLSGLIGAVIGPLRWIGSVNFVDGYAGRVRMLVLLFVMCFAAVLVPYLIGRRVRENDITGQERARAAEQRYQAELATREERARATEARVRNDIARELHDVVAHSLSVIIVQAEGGKALARKNPPAAAETLDTIAETGREALTEMRRMVGVLRAGPGGTEYAPQPGLGDIAEMVQRAGDRVSLQVTGAQPAVPATVGLAAYRVVQEALTNFFKHVGPQATCRVQINYGAADIDIEVADNGMGSKAPNDGAGNGLKGMQERVGAVGGKLNARARRTGGFQVKALLPIAAKPPKVATSEPASAPAQADGGEPADGGVPAAQPADPAPEGRVDRGAPHQASPQGPGHHDGPVA